MAVGEGEPEGWCGVEAWLEGDPIGELEHRGRPDDVLYQMYTSGTTGLAQGRAAHPPQRRSPTARRSAPGCGYRRSTSGDRWLIVAPLFHAAAVITAFCCVARRWVPRHPEGFDPPAWSTRWPTTDIALTTLVPAMIQACLAVPGVDDRDYPALRSMAYGGSAIAEPTLLRAMEVFGCDFYQGFGQTESSAGLTYLTELDHRAAVAGRPELLASCGQALPGTELRIVDAPGSGAPARRRSGEVMARGPQLMVGYWNRPEETAATLRDGWLRTGDVGIARRARLPHDPRPPHATWS